MPQYTIDIGAAANDGTGDPLRTAFNEVNLNFDQVFTAGPVLSNVRIANNTILTTTTNGNLILAPNGTGVVQSNVHIVPNASNIRNLGSYTQRWSTLYVQYANVSGGLTVADLSATGNVTVGGNLSVTGNIIYIGNLITDAKTIQLANTAGTANAADGSGITVGANDNIATMLYSSATNAWTFNIGVDTPNIVVNNITSDDSTFVTIQDGLDVQGDVTAETLSVAGNITGNYFIGNGSQLTGIMSSYGNANVTTLLADYGSNTISTTGNVTSNYFIGNGSQLTGLSTSSISNGTSNVSIATANGPVTVSYAGSGNTWTFGDVNVPEALYWPDGSFQATAFVGQALDLVNTGNASITSNSTGNTTYVWTFGDDGRLTFPGTPRIDTDSDNFEVQAAENISFEANAVVNIYTDTSGNAYQWQFGDDGNLSAPGAISAVGNVTSGNILTGGLISAAGNVTGANIITTGNISGNTAGFAIGYLNIPQVSLAANATIAATDPGKHYYSTSASNLTLTIANNTSVSWAVGTAITVVNRGSGNITVAQGTGVSLYLAGNSSAANRTVSTYGMATLINLEANVWMINGTGLT